MSANVDEIIENMRKKLGDDVDLSYLTQSYVDEMMANAQDADKDDDQEGVEYTITYGNSLFESGGVYYWYADAPITDRKGGCGSYHFQSTRVIETELDGPCPSGLLRYKLTKKF